MNQQDAHKKGRIKPKWRKPRGSDSKMRRKIRGYSSSPSSGLRSEIKTRNMLGGLLPVTVHTLTALTAIDIAKEVAVIGSSVGMRKKTQLVQEAQKRNIPLYNVKDAALFLKNIDEELQSRKARRKKLSEKAEKKKKEEKKAEKEEKESKEESPLEKAISGEEQKKEEKQEKDKLLTKKDGKL